MKRFSTAIFILVLAAVFSLPASVSAAEEPGIKPGSFFYGFVTTFEKINLFFTFNPEKKAEKALRYADKRLAEAEVATDEENSDAVKIAVAGYEENIALAAEASKKVKDETRAENLLTLIADNTSKHQEVLSVVLLKVPEEAKEAITKAIEASKKGQEEAMQKIAELKGEVEKLKQEVVELKAKDEEREKKIEELSRQKTGSQATQQKISTPQTPTTPTSKTEPTKTNIVTLPNGAVVEIDVGGNIIRMIKEAVQTYISPAPAQSGVLEIMSVSVNILPEQTSAKIEWQTSKPASSKVFISGGNLPSTKVFGSESGLSTRHIASIGGLARGFKFSYEIEAIMDGTVVTKKTGNFETEAPRPAKMNVYAWRDDRTLENSRNSSLFIYGCETKYFEVAFLDQYGDRMFGPEVIVTTPTGSLTKTITQTDKLSDNNYGARFWYSPSSINTNEIITFVSGNFRQEANLQVGKKHPQLECPDKSHLGTISQWSISLLTRSINLI